MKSRISKLTGRFFRVLSVVMVVMCVVACENNLDVDRLQQEEESLLSISIVPQTKASGSAHGVQADDNNVQSLEIFVFKNEGADAGVLDVYKKFTAEELKSLTNIEIQTTAGSKIIYAVANSHKDNWNGVYTLQEFKSVLSLLKDEDLKSFTMVGSANSTLQATTSVNIEISRLVARVHLAGIKTNFAGTPYEGISLKNVKAYLINVTGDCSYADGSMNEDPLVLNQNGLKSDDVDACTMRGMLYDEMAQEVSDGGYNVSHYFYCYENMLSEESGNKKFTKLVIQGDLNGTTYYYPISINREGYGYSPENDHKGLKRNTSYSIEITITRPGTLDPNDNLNFGTATAMLDILDWVTLPVAHVGF
ncbi:MAG: DUF4906 domain-containing protein [Bacteroidales bacterium]|nr:DUF4906 domain-containing protein [Bacteroidales bacterium]